MKIYRCCALCAYCVTGTKKIDFGDARALAQSSCSHTNTLTHACKCTRVRTYTHFPIHTYVVYLASLLLAPASRLARTHTHARLPYNSYISMYIPMYALTCILCAFVFSYLSNLFITCSSLWQSHARTHTPALIDTRASVSKELCVPCVTYHFEHFTSSKHVVLILKIIYFGECF